MFRVDILRQGQLTNSAQFSSQEEALSWLQQHESNRSFGNTAEWLSEAQAQSRGIESALETRIVEVPAVLDEEGNEITPASSATEYYYAAEYVVEGPTDITAEVEQERINSEAQAYLASTDWYAVRFAETGLEIPEDVRLKRQAARDRIVR